MRRKTFLSPFFEIGLLRAVPSAFIKNPSRMNTKLVTLVISTIYPLNFPSSSPTTLW